MLTEFLLGEFGYVFVLVPFAKLHDIFFAPEMNLPNGKSDVEVLDSSFSRTRNILLESHVRHLQESLSVGHLHREHVSEVFENQLADLGADHRAQVPTFERH